jgi:hypothetical protein
MRLPQTKNETVNMADIDSAALARNTGEDEHRKPDDNNVIEFPHRHRLDARDAEIASIRDDIEALRAGIRKTLKFYQLSPERRAEIESKRWVSRNYPDVIRTERILRRIEKAHRAEVYDALAKAYYRREGEAEAEKAAKAKKGKQPRLDPAPDAPEPNAKDFVDELARPPILYVYRNADGSVHSFIARWGTGKNKKLLPYFWGQGPGRAPGWVNQRHPSPILYRLPEVLAGVREGKTVVILEGEKDVHGAIDRFGEEFYVFTTPPGGALNTEHWRAWEGVDYSPLSVARVLLVPDPGGDGRAWGKGIAQILMRMNGAARPPLSIEVGTIPPMSKGWHNGAGKPWGFGDPCPGCATDADIERILTEAVPLEEWLRPFEEPPPHHPDDPGPGSDPRDAPPQKFTLVRYRFIQPTLSGLWRIKGLLPSRGLFTVFGEPGCGKSFFTLDMGMHLASHLDYLGRRVTPGRVVYIAAEGQGAFRNRVVACGRKLCLDDPQFDLIEVAPNLGSKFGDTAALIQAIEAGAESNDLPVACVVVDTLSQTMGGENENNEGMAAFIVNANRISTHFANLTIAVHHTGKTDTTNPRGWSGLHGANDGEIRITGTTGTRTGEVTKIKDGDSLGFKFQFDLDSVEIGTDEEDGTPVTTCVVANIRPLTKDEAEAETLNAKKSASKPTKRSQREFDKAFDEAMEAHAVDCIVEGEGKRAVYVKQVRPFFATRWAVLEPDKRKKQKKVSDAFNAILKALPPNYHTLAATDDDEWIWRD